MIRLYSQDFIVCEGVKGIPIGLLFTRLQEEVERFEYDCLNRVFCTKWVCTLFDGKFIGEHYFIKKAYLHPINGGQIDSFWKVNVCVLCFFFCSCNSYSLICVAKIRMFF